MRRIVTMILLLLHVNAVGEEREANLKLKSEETPKLDEDKQSKIEADLIRRYGLSSTGEIELLGIYRLTHEEAIGAAREKIAVFTQEDLLGGRLFWICLVNLDTGKSLQIYRTGGIPSGATPKGLTEAEQ